MPHKLVPTLCGLGKSFFQNLTAAIRALCRLLENAIRYARI
jgi:hypothetical protein